MAGSGSAGEQAEAGRPPVGDLPSGAQWHAKGRPSGLLGPTQPLDPGWQITSAAFYSYSGPGNAVVSGSLSAVVGW